MAALLLALPLAAQGRSPSQGGHNAQTQNHPPNNHPAHHSDSAPAQPGTPGTGGNPGLGTGPTGPQGPAGTPPGVVQGPVIGVHIGPGGTSTGGTAIAPVLPSYPVPPNPVLNTPPQATVAVPPQVLPLQQTPYLVPPTPVINTPPQATVAVPPQALPPQRTPQPRPLSVTQPVAAQLPGSVTSQQIGHAAIFQHAHAAAPERATRKTDGTDTSGVFLPPQVSHGVITPAVALVADPRIAQPRGVALYCLLPTVGPDGTSFGGLLEPPPGWAPAQTVTSAHVSLQGGANYIDPVLRSLPVNHPPHSACLVDLVVQR